MLGRETLERLGQINRQAIWQATVEPAVREQSVAARTDSSRSTAGWPAADAAPPLRGYEQQTCWGTHWRIDHAFDDLAPHWTVELARASRLLPALAIADEVHPDQRQFATAFPTQAIYLDLETCGFAGSMVFLAGVVHHESDGFVLSQLLARNYAEEKAMLQTLWQLVAGKRVLVTFNGKSFDWPVVHDRSTVHRLGRDPRGGWPPQPAAAAANTSSEQPASGQMPHEPPSAGTCEQLTRDDTRPEPLHFDLLHHSRRRWRDSLPNCKLQTLESYVCGRRRACDIPSHAIPQAYHDFVRSGDPQAMRSILHHNALDLITLWQLSLRIYQ